MGAELVGGRGEKEIKKKGGGIKEEFRSVFRNKKESGCFILAGVMNLLEPWAQNQASKSAVWHSH